MDWIFYGRSHMLITSGSYKVKGKEIWDFDNLLLNTG